MRRLALLSILGLSFAGCGEEKTPGVAGNYGDYEEENVTLIGDEDGSATGDERMTVVADGLEGDCVQVSDSVCVPIEGEWCEGEGG